MLLCMPRFLANEKPSLAAMHCTLYNIKGSEMIQNTGLLEKSEILWWQKTIME